MAAVVKTYNSKKLKIQKIIGRNLTYCFLKKSNINATDAKTVSNGAARKKILNISSALKNIIFISAENTAFPKLVLATIVPKLKYAKIQKGTVVISVKPAYFAMKENLKLPAFCELNKIKPIKIKKSRKVSGLTSIDSPIRKNKT
jgi:hypothetical protein